MSVHLLADIGGTNTRFALARPGIGVLTDSFAAYPNRSAKRPEDLIQRFLGEQGQPACDRAVLALAAPITGAAITLTNHNWCFTRDGISAASGAGDVRFINDFEALGYGLAAIGPDHAQHLTGPHSSPAASARMVVGAGTGFNAAALWQNGVDAPRVCAMEAGHMTLPMQTPTEFDLWQYLSRNRGRASVERALSGAGIAEIYSWFRDRNGLATDLTETHEITQLAQADPESHAAETMRLLARLMGRVVGDLALAFLPLGGIYLSGSVTRAASPWLETPAFKDAFCAKGRQQSLMKQFPVYILHDDRAALLGCEIAARQAAPVSPNSGASQ